MANAGHTEILTEWAVDHRDQQPMFACLMLFPDRQTAMQHSRATSSPLIKRETTVTRTVGEWTSTT